MQAITREQPTLGKDHPRTRTTRTTTKSLQTPRHYVARGEKHGKPDRPSLYQLSAKTKQRSTKIQSKQGRTLTFSVNSCVERAFRSYKVMQVFVHWYKIKSSFLFVCDDVSVFPLKRQIFCSEKRKANLPSVILCPREIQT